MRRHYGNKHFSRPGRPTDSSSVVAAVLFACGNNTLHQETKQGSYIFSGDAGNFHEWEFRVEIRWKSTKAEDYGKTINTIIESLRGDAALLAMDTGGDALMATHGSGFTKLVGAVRANVFLQARAEAKEDMKAAVKASKKLEPELCYKSG